MPELHLTPDWKASQKNTFENHQAQLGDGYQQMASIGTNPEQEQWEISKSGLSTLEVEALLAQFSQWAGVTTFDWRPIPEYAWRKPLVGGGTTFFEFPEKKFYCKVWSRSPLGSDLWQFKATLIREYLEEGS